MTATWVTDKLHSSSFCVTDKFTRLRFSACLGMFVIITALKLNEQNKLNKLSDTSCDVTMQVNGESLCLCDNVARFLVSSAIDFRL